MAAPARTRPQNRGDEEASVASRLDGTGPDFFTRPNVARVWDAWLNGKDTFAADRDEAERVEAVFGPPARDHLPAPREMAVRNRQFLCRAVTYAAQEGVSQFIDLGAGFPVSGRIVQVPGKEEIRLQDVHQAAQAVNPAARCVYVDSDPVCALHLKVLAGSEEGVAVTEGDLAAPAAILADPVVREVIDPGEPCCVILGMVAHYLPPEVAREVIAGYTAAVAPGSHLVVSSARFDDPALWERARAAYTAARTWNHSRADVTSFFDGTVLADPGVVPARGWKAGWRDCPSPDAAAYVLCGVGKVRGAGGVIPGPPDGMSRQGLTWLDPTRQGRTKAWLGT